MLKLEGFEIIEKLGEGGMATVWKARQKSLDRFVAIKELSSAFASTDEDVKRFMDEARTTAKLRHPGIVQVYDASFQDGTYLFIMEFIDGYSIGELIQEQGQTAEKEALTIGTCVAEALEYGWTKFGMVHCDIKPDNVLVDSDGTVKVTDLGLSRTVKGLWFGSNMEAEQDVFGTPAYMAPEQAMGDPTIDCRADMYSLGAMMYHMVTGRMLFAHEPSDKVMELQCTSKDENPQTLNPNLSRPFCDLVEKLLAKDRDNRYHDWGEVIADIDCVRNGKPLQSGAPEPDLSTVNSLPREKPRAVRAPRRSAAVGAPRRAARMPKAVAVPSGNVPVKSSVRAVRLNPGASSAASSHVRKSVLSSPAVTGGPKGRNDRTMFFVAVGLVSILLVYMISSSVKENRIKERERQLRQMRIDNATRHYDRAEQARVSGSVSIQELEKLYRLAWDAAPGTQVAQNAKDQLEYAKVMMRQKSRDEFKALRTRAEGLMGSGDYSGAAALVSGYSAPVGSELLVEKERLMQEIADGRNAYELRRDAEETQRRAEDKARRDRERLDDEMRGHIRKLKGLISDNDITKARNEVDMLKRSSPEVASMPELWSVIQFVEDADAARRGLQKNFSDIKGKTVQFDLRSGARGTYEVQEFIPHRGEISLRANVNGNSIAMKLMVWEVATHELLDRMPGENTQGGTFERAMLCVQARDYRRAISEASSLPAEYQRIVRRDIPSSFLQ